MESGRADVWLVSGHTQDLLEVVLDCDRDTGESCSFSLSLLFSL